VDNGNQLKRDLGPQSQVPWSQPLLLAVIGLGLFVLFAPNAAVRPPADAPRDAVARRALESAKSLAPSLGPAGSQLASERRRPALVPEKVSPVARPESPAPPSERAQHLSELDALVSHVKQMKVVTAEGATYIKRMLRDLRQQGEAAVPAIGAFLRQGEDVNFATMSGGQLVGHRTLRQAMIDTLREIGGSEAMAVSLQQVQQTREPLEVAMLARSLEKEEPGVHSEEVIQAIGNALQWAEHATAKELPDVSPLFDRLRAYGGEQAVAVLERSVPQWGEYALIALAGLPDGAGIPSLTALAGTADAPVANPVLPFQILAQTTVHYPEAGDALVDLARAGQIPDQVWGAMGEALGGKHLQFSGKMFDGTPLAENSTAASGARAPLKNYYIEWLNVRYEEDVMSVDWSAEQVEQQLALIGDLLEATSSPAAAQALQQARASLQGGRAT
jgi:hypothetical protein